MLKKVESIVVIVAGVLAIFPILQFWLETEDRKLAHEATLVVSYMSCLGTGGLATNLDGSSPEGIREICTRVAQRLSEVD